MHLSLALTALVLVAALSAGCGIRSGELRPSASVMEQPRAAHIAGNAPLYTGSVNSAPETPLRGPVSQERRFLGVVVDDADTLPRIALRYRVPVETIMAANNLKDQRIEPGQFLIIPLYL